MNMILQLSNLAMRVLQITDSLFIRLINNLWWARHCLDHLFWGLAFQVMNFAYGILVIMV